MQVVSLRLTRDVRFWPIADAHLVHIFLVQLLREIALVQPERDVHQGDQNGYFDQRANDGGECDRRANAERTCRHRNHKPEVVTGILSGASDSFSFAHRNPPRRRLYGSPQAIGNGQRRALVQNQFLADLLTTARLS